MSVAVVIANLNYGQYLERSIRSAQQQTIPPAEVIIVDGGSTDNSKEIAENLCAGWIDALPQRQANARNIGVQSTACEFVVPLDADDWIEPNYVERCLDTMLRDDGIGAVAPDLIWPDGRVQPTTPPFSVDRFLQGNLMFCCSMFRRKAWKQVGGYDEAPAIYEDWLMWGMMVAAGWKILPLREPLFHYNPHAGSSTDRMPVNGDAAYRIATIQKLSAHVECKLARENRYA
jgi:glycosyltransferase involved in cell wall biosynthesis